MPKRAIFTVGGTVQACDGLYISRRADAELLAICSAGTFAYVLTPRQLGKSSLMVRTAEQLSQEGVRTVLIDLSQIGVQVTAEEWYLGMLVMIDEQLDLETDPLSWWQRHGDFGVTHRLNMFFEDVLLKEVTDPMVIFVDEIDTTLRLNFTDDFFAAIRSLHNRRAFARGLKRLSFVLIGVATPGDLIQDFSRTPFNIGQGVELSDFTFEEAQPLSRGFGLPDAMSDVVLRWILGWTGGHPYLTQRVCKLVADRATVNLTESDVDKLVTDDFLTPQWDFNNNLLFVRDMLLFRAPDSEAALRTYQKIRCQHVPVFDEPHSITKLHLKLAGLVISKDGSLYVRNRIYREAFDDKWINDHLPSMSMRFIRAVKHLFRGRASSLANDYKSKPSWG